MKKIFRMALVFALAGATLMYTGCTKDFEEEINKLDNKVNTLQNDLSGKLSDLEGQVSTLKSGVSALESAYKAADDVIKGDVSGLKTKVAAIEDAIKDLDKLASKDELKAVKEALEKKIADDLKDVKDELLAKAQNLQDQIDVINETLALKADADKVYTKDEVAEILAKYYTSEKVDEFLAAKADKDAVYTKDEIVAFLAEKADKSSVYTKDEIADILKDYMTAEEVQALLDKKADADKVYTKDEIATILLDYLTAEQIQALLDKKADADAVYTKAEIEEMLAAYYTSEKVDELLAAKADADKVYTKAEIEEMLAAYYTAEKIDEMFAAYYTAEKIDELLAGYYTAEKIDELLQDLKDAQDELDKVFELLSDELRSIVFLPDFYFAGIEATSYDFGSFLGWKMWYYTNYMGMPAAMGGFSDYLGANATFGAGALLYGYPYYLTDASGKDLYFMLDPETGDFARDDDGNLVPAKASTPDNLKSLYYPGNHVQGQIGEAKYNLNPSSFPVDQAEWSLKGRNVKYVVRSEDNTWTPVFEGITKDSDGLATVKYSIEHPEWLFSSVLGAYIDGLIYWISRVSGELYGSEELEDYGLVAFFFDHYLSNWFSNSGSLDNGPIYIGPKVLKQAATLEQVREGSYYNFYEYLQSYLAAWEYDYNNIPTMQLVGTLSDGRAIFSDWHAISSTEELVDHLAFRNDNPWVTYWDNCGLGKAVVAGGDDEKDLFPTAYYTLDTVASVKVKYNGGPVDLAELIAIHTVNFQATTSPIASFLNGYGYASYTLDEFNAKYPGYHFEFKQVPYTLGDELTGEQYYGQLSGDYGKMFTPCYVKSLSATQPVSVPIEKDDQSITGISSVGRQPMILATLVNDETGIIQAYGYFRIILVKDIKEPRTFVLPELPTVPYICGNFRISTNWHQFSDFVLEALGMDYKAFLNTYKFDGIWGYNGKKFEQIDDKMFTGTQTEINPGSWYGGNIGNNLPPFDKDSWRWGRGIYSVDYTGSSVNDAFIWDVLPQGVGEGKSATIYYRFSAGEEDIVYFAMTANVAERPHMVFATNKRANEWFDDIDGEAKNTVRMNVPVPTADKTEPVIGGDVTLFMRDINHWFVGYRPQLGLGADSDPLYAKFFNANAWSGDPDKGDPDYDGPAGLGYDDNELETHTEYYFSKEQPVIVDDVTGAQYPLYSNWWGDYYDESMADSESGPYDEDGVIAAGKLLYTAKTNAWGQPIMMTVGDPDNLVSVPEPFAENFVAVIYPRGEEEIEFEEGEATYTGVFDTDTIQYLTTDIAKKLLNLWSYKETDQAKMLYANVTAKNTYGFCEIPVEDGNFHIRFIRPLDVNFADQDVAEESAPDGFNVELVKFIDGITDWNNQKVLVDSTYKDKNGKTVVYEPKTLIPNVVKTVDYYAYYGFDSLRIDLSKAEVDHWQVGNPTRWGKLSGADGVAPKAKLKLGKIDDDEVFTEFADGEPAGSRKQGTTYIISMEQFSNLRDIYINYRNDEAFADEFNLRIPVSIDYAWGTLNAYLVVHVKDTGSTHQY